MEVRGMQDLSLHILDVVQNSIRAHAKQIIIQIQEIPSKNQLILMIEDNGDGMSRELVSQIVDPFVTTRTLRRVGLGIPLLKQSCDISQGELHISSTIGEGTLIKARMAYNHIDRIPLGDMVSTMIILIQANPLIDFIYEHQYEEKKFVFKTQEVKAILEDIPIDHLEVLVWLKSYLKENINCIRK